VDDEIRASILKNSTRKNGVGLDRNRIIHGRKCKSSLQIIREQE
jgi:hypothetical protein